ncbi:Ig-like domain-containing protein [Isoptericola sp. NPDC019693]|uniref:Ig-like domain-containing protein n=1 Tax=Isoptericola sp. NPDC019693 TaxID=3364009 RepID=UPI00379C45D0
MRADAGVRRWMAAVGAMLTLALVSTGLAVPPAVADVGEDSTVIAPTEERWWTGQDITLGVQVTRDGAPGTGYVEWFEDGRGSYFQRAPLTDGRATVVIPSRYLQAGRHTVEVRHVEMPATVDPETGQRRYTSSDSVEFEVAEPAAPVLGAASWYYGDRHELRFDVTGTDEPREGTVGLVLKAGGTERSATLVDGVATFGLDGTELTSGGNVRLTHRSASGTYVSGWTLPVTVRSKPVTLTAPVPSGVRYGSDVVVPVKVTSSLGTPTGRVYLQRIDTENLASAVVVDGRATLRIPASRLPFGESRLTVRFNGSPEYESTSRSGRVVVRPRATSVTVSTPKTWTYGKARRVAVKVTSPSATPTGRVELWSYGRKLRSATLSRGQASLYLPATLVKPAEGDRQYMVVKYVGPSTFERSQRAWSQKVIHARPKVTLRLDRTSFPNDWSARRSVRATVTVKTAGVPERGKLCLWSREPYSIHKTWAGCWVNWSWKVDDGWRTIRVPGVMLQGVGKKSYLKVEYIPKDPNVRQTFSNTVTLRHTAP